MEPKNPDPNEMNYVEFSNTMWENSTTSWRPRKYVFDDSWSLFWNQYDFSKKAPWQSKNFVPKLNRMVRQAAFAFKNALVSSPDYFTVDGVGAASKEKAWVPAKILHFWSESEGLINKITDSIFTSLLSSIMIFKIYWETAAVEEVVAPSTTPETGAGKMAAAMSEPAPGPNGSLSEPLKTQKKLRGRMRVDVIDPYYFRIDPTGRKKFYIHEYDMDLYDLKELAKDPANKYEVEEVEKINTDFINHQQEMQKSLRKNELTISARASYRKQVKVREYWGEIFSKDGKLIGRNMTFSVANEQYLIRKPMKNPYFTDELPFVVGAPLRVPFSNWHQSFAEQINGLQRMATEIYNLTMDSNLWASIKAFEIDLDQVVDAAELKNGVYPGKAFKKRSRGQQRQMITPLELGITNPQNLQFYNAVDREMQNETGVTEFSAGFVGGRQNVLATEVKAKGADSRGYLDSIASEIEENVLDKVLDKMWKLVLNFQDNFEDERLRELLGDEVSDILGLLSPSGRRDYLGGHFKFLFRGMSKIMEKQQDIQKLNLLQETLKNVPQAAQFLNPVNLIRRFFSALNWNPEEMIDMRAAVAAGHAAPPQAGPTAPNPQEQGAAMMRAALHSPPMMPGPMGQGA